MKKGIIGGTFDPFHNGHLHIAYEALKKLNLDKVVFMPTGNPPHKDFKKVTDGKIRYEIVKKAIENEKNFEVNNYEINKKGFCFTYETLNYLNELEKETEWYFISGADCLMDIETWKNVEMILNSCSFTVFKRPGYKAEQLLSRKNFIEKKYNGKILIIDIPTIDISSSYIREKIASNIDISQLVPKSVKEDIERLKLYK